MSEIRPTDQEIEHGIDGRLAADPRLNPANLSVHVVAGRVRLGGTVLIDEERRWAVEDVGSVPGVTEVQDETTVLTDSAPRTGGRGPS